MWTALLFVVWQKDCKLIHDAHILRDEMLAASDNGRAACEVASFGTVSQELGDPTLALAGEYPEAWATRLKPELDVDVFPTLMTYTARASLSTFTSLPHQICDDPRIKLLVGPIKKPARISVKVAEYKEENEGQWPFICKARVLVPSLVVLRLVTRAFPPSAPLTAQQVGDVLRSTLVCQDGDSMHLAIERLIATFGLCEGNGRLKNLLPTTKHMPPRVLINCIVRAAGCTPIMAECQVYLAGIKKLADAQHRYYEIRRASALSELQAEADAHSKEPESSEPEASSEPEEPPLGMTESAPQEPVATASAESEAEATKPPCVFMCDT